MKKSSQSRLPMGGTVAGAVGLLPRWGTRTIFLLSKDAEEYKVSTDAGRPLRTGRQIGERREDHSGARPSFRKQKEQKGHPMGDESRMQYL